MVPSASEVPQPLPRVLYSLHIDDEEPISCVVRIRDNGADMVLIRSRHGTPWRMRINSCYPEDVVWKVGMGMLAGFSPSMKLIDPWAEVYVTPIPGGREHASAACAVSMNAKSRQMVARQKQAEIQMTRA